MPNSERIKARLVARLKELKGRFEFKLTSTPIHARTRRLRARWTAELDQELQTHYHISVEAALVKALREVMERDPELMRSYAKKKLNKKLYSKVVIRGKPNRNTNAAARNRKRRRNVRA